MDYFSSGNRFAHLSLADLLRARDQFHAHLVHKKNVIGTAIGRYLIRKSDPYPPARRPPGPKPPRTLQDSEIRDYSWPCVLVFVDNWIDDPGFVKGELPASDYVPKTIYLEDGKAVPICLVFAPAVGTPPDPRPAPVFDPELPQGGHPVVSETQKIAHRATVGCLLTDGHKVYALTARHVAGSPGQQLKTEDGVVVGTTSALQLSRIEFERAYAPWPGKHTFVNLDVALVEVDDLNVWSTGIEGIGPIGPLAALSTYNLSLNLIGCPVRSHGASSGPMFGRVAALFYRYKAVGGFEYTADFLIGSRDEEPLTTLPGDSGAVWVVDGTGDDLNRPIAVQWGGTVLGAQEAQSTFALASNLSTVCRELNVDVYRGPAVAAFEYWGEIGHQRIGEIATRLVKDAKLKKLLAANSKNMGALAVYPDSLWKAKPRPETRRFENPTHYADIDLAIDGQTSLDELTPDRNALKTATWREYYSAVDISPGILPFRVWHVWQEIVRIVKTKNVAEIVAAMGILGHYVGDSCQPLHGSYLTNGDPFRDRDGNEVEEMLGHNDPMWGRGVHSAYETKMISANQTELRKRVLAGLPDDHGMELATSGRDAAWESLELLRRSMKRIDPTELVDSYANKEKLWTVYRDRTVETMTDGCRVLAMLWESAWTAGNGNAIDADDLVGIKRAALEEICAADGDFLESPSIDNIDDFIS
jgi:S1/P1 Nuclease